MEQSEQKPERKYAYNRSKQCTLKDRILLEGVGVHSGKICKISVDPASMDSGISYLRDGIKISANYANVFDTNMCTRLKDDSSGATISVVEHISAAFYALGITNALVRVIEGDEIPFMDGSSIAFAEAIEKAGIEEQSKERKRIVITRKVEVGDPKRWASLKPLEKNCLQHKNSSGKFVAEGGQPDVTREAHLEQQSQQKSSQQQKLQKQQQRNSLLMRVQCDFSDRGLSTLPYTLPFSYDFSIDDLVCDFNKNLAPARTFGFFSDVEYLRANNLALGASMDNTVVFGEGGSVMNPEGTRYDNEPVRHKTLDAVGDLSLAGYEIEGCYEAFCPGHGLNNALLKELFKDERNYRIVP